MCIVSTPDSYEPRPRLALFGEQDLRPTRRAMKQFAQGLPFDNRQVADITLAVAEACVNGVRHGTVRPIETDEPVVTVTASPAKDHLSIEVQDYGDGFNFERPAMPEATAESGRGIALIHALMDHVAITSTRGGTHIRMVKYFTAAPSRK